MSSAGPGTCWRGLRRIERAKPSGPMLQGGIGSFLVEGIDTTTPGGTLVLHFFGAVAQFERDLIR